MSILIQEAHLQHASIIRDFQLAMALETENLQLDPDTVDAGVKAVFNDSSKGRYYLASSEGKPVASLLTTYEWSDWRNKQVIWIQSVYVVPSYRKQGVFAQMYQYIRTLVEQASGYAGIRLYVDNTNLSAQKVYNAMGMNGEHYTLFEDMQH